MSWVACEECPGWLVSDREMLWFTFDAAYIAT